MPSYSRFSKKIYKKRTGGRPKRRISSRSNRKLFYTPSQPSRTSAATRFSRGMRPEMKRLGYNFNSLPLELDNNTGSRPIRLPFCDINRADTVNGRDGDVIFSRSISGQLAFKNNEATNIVYIRCVLYRAKCPSNTTVPADSSEFIYSPGDKAQYTISATETKFGSMGKIMLPLNPYEPYQPMYERIIKLNVAATGSTEAGSVKWVKFKIPTNFRISFSGETNNQCRNNLTWLMWAADSITKTPGVTNEILIDGELVHYFNDV